MTDTDFNAGAPASENGASAPPEAGVRIMAQFIRDLSFENPRAPDSLRAGASQPQIDLGVEMNARSRQDGLFEVDLKISATAQHDDETVFQVELLYGGLFQVSGVSDADLEPVLMIECPRYLFPFARRVISDVTAEGGFPPLMLDPLDFASIYAARRSEAPGSAIGRA